MTCEKIWDKFDMKNMGDYQDHYFKKDVLLLADVFENFINTCLKCYGLDPYHYFSSPGLRWDAMLKMTGEKLEQISDIDKFLFIEKGLRGGICYIAKRYAKANNKYTDRLILLLKFLIKILLLFMKLNQFQYLTNQFMLD